MKTAATQGSDDWKKWGLSWTYDRYGNRTQQSVTHGTGPSNSVSVSTSTNKITTSGYSYDANGNMDNDGLNALVYDAENRVSSINSGATTYSYDAAGLRVKKVTGSTTTVYAFSGTKVIAEYVNGSLDKEYIYSGSALVATHDTGTLKYHHSDHLSMRVTTNTSGGIIAEQGHYPFGESWYQGSGGSKIQFTSYERDGESGNDYAIFRSYINRLGRFNRPDPLHGFIDNPQSVNRYRYAGNDPVNRIDPLGLLDLTGLGWISGPHTVVNVFGLPDVFRGGGAGADIFMLNPDEKYGQGGDDPPPPLNEAMRAELAKRLEGFEKSNCAKVFSQVIPKFSVQSLSKHIGTVNFYNARKEPDMNYTQDQIVGNGDQATLNNSLRFGADARAIWGSAGSAVLLGGNFFSNTNSSFQRNTLLHEVLHTFTRWNDATIFGRFADHGLTQKNPGSGDITDWLARDCRPERK